MTGRAGNGDAAVAWRGARGRSRSERRASVHHDAGVPMLGSRAQVAGYCVLNYSTGMLE
jgi:hypothetical protein